MATKNTTRKRATAADIAAAVALGTMDGNAPVALPSEGDDESPEIAVRQTGSEHACDIPGCRHGAAHNGSKQPDRQVKLQCPTCGAVARMTSGALAKALGINCHRDGAAFVPAERRTYNRKS